MDQNNSVNPQAPIAQGNRTEPSVGIKNLRIILIAIVVILIFSAGLLFISSRVFNKPKTYILTSKDLDSTVQIKKNDTVLVETKTIPGLVLKTEISDPSVVQGSEAYDEKTGKFIGKFVGKSKGTSDVIVTGSPPCKKNEICLPLEIVVSKNRIVVDK